MKTMKLITVSIMLCLLSAAAIYANHFNDGNNSYLSGDYDKALEGYSQFIRDKPDYFEGYYNAGNSLYRQEKYEDALKMYNKALELNPKDEDTKVNIQVTGEKIKKQEENKDNKKDKDNKDNKQDKGKDGKDKQGRQGKNSKGRQDKGQQGKGQEAGENQKNSGAGAGQQKAADKPDPQKELGMSADEVQALMNMTQKSEKDYKNYFGKQYRHKQNENDFPNVFNMSPEEIHNYMMRQMMEPDNMQQSTPKGNSKEKDW